MFTMFDNVLYFAPVLLFALTLFAFAVSLICFDSYHSPAPVFLKSVYVSVYYMPVVSSTRREYCWICSV